MCKEHRRRRPCQRPRQSRRHQQRRRRRVVVPLFTVCLQVGEADFHRPNTSWQRDGRAKTSKLGIFTFSPVVSGLYDILVTKWNKMSLLFPSWHFGFRNVVVFVCFSSVWLIFLFRRSVFSHKYLVSYTVTPDPCNAFTRHVKDTDRRGTYRE